MSKNDFQTNPDMLRPNYKILSSPYDPVYTLSTSLYNPNQPTIIESLETAFSKLGQRYLLNTTSLSIPNNNYLVTQFTIPANWGKTLYVDRIRAGTSSSSIVDFIAIANPITGTAITPKNTNLGSTNTTSITALYSITGTNPSTATPLLTFILAGGTFETSYGGAIIIPSKSTVQYYCIRVTNTGTGNTTCMTTFSWWEV